MAFTPLNSTEILPTKPVKTELWNTVKDNFDDHESRIISLQGSDTTDPAQFVVRGDYYTYGAKIGVAFIRAAYALTITDVKLFIVDAGASGTLQVDIQKKSGVGAFATIFSTKPSVLFSAGDYSTSTNAAVSVGTVLAGDILRLDISTVMTGNDEFHVYLFHDVGV